MERKTNKHKAAVALGAGAGALMLLPSSQQSYLVPTSRTPRAALRVGSSAEKQKSNACTEVGNQLRTVTSSAIATGALTVAAAVTNSRNFRSGRLRSIPCASQTPSEMPREEQEANSCLNQLVSLAAEVVSQPHQVGEIGRASCRERV